MVNFKKILFVLSFILIEIQNSFAAGSISDLFVQIGNGYSTIFNSAPATYFFLVTGLFFGLVMFMNSGLQKVPHLSGRPAKVISGIVSFMGVTLMVYGKSAAEVIDLFKGSVGSFFAILFSSVILAGTVWFSKKFKSKLSKTLIISSGVFIGTSFLIPILKTYLKTINGHVVSGSSDFILSLLDTVNSVSQLVLFICIILLVIKLFGGIENPTGLFKNKSKIKNLLKKINSDFDSLQKKLSARNIAIKGIVPSSLGGTQAAKTNSSDSSADEVLVGSDRGEN